MAPGATRLTAAEIKRVSIFTSPVLVTTTFLRVCIGGVVAAASWAGRHASWTAATVAASAVVGYTLHHPPVGMETTAAAVLEHGSFAVYWLVLGVLSSIGLGSGLHTFVLFLGPHIVRIASAALLHRTTAFSARIASYFKWPTTYDVAGLAEAFSPNYELGAFAPVHEGSEEVAYVDILAKVASAAFLWGLGTAMGELPPYFIALAARKSGEALEELAEVTELEAEAVAEAAARKRPGAGGRKGGGSRAVVGPAHQQHHHLGLVDRAKVWVYESIQKYGFLAVFLAASIPNPLFDLAGLTCGHFGIPFATFFGATFLGKAVVKVSLQVFFIIAVVKWGPAGFDAARRSVAPGTLAAQVVEGMERSIVSSQQAFCADSPGAECDVCCHDNFRRFGHDQCLAMCAGRQGEGATPHPADGGGWARAAWGYILLSMIAYFLISIVHSIVQEQLVKDLVEGVASGEEPVSRAAAATGGAALGTPHHHGVHGAQVISALLHADDLKGGKAGVQVEGGGVRTPGSGRRGNRRTTKA